MSGLHSLVAQPGLAKQAGSAQSMRPFVSSSTPLLQISALAEDGVERVALSGP